jgi:superfamily I DNA and/or RNA helicase
LRTSGLLDGWVENPYQWVRDRVGTVHTVQGREAEAVFFILGAPDVQQRGARGWAGSRPNLLNVAATRAKEALYVVGNRSLWKTAGVFQSLDDFLG